MSAVWVALQKSVNGTPHTPPKSTAAGLITKEHWCSNNCKNSTGPLIIISDQRQWRVEA